MAKAYIEGDHKRRQVLWYIKPYELIPTPGMFIDNLNHFTISAIQDCHACLFETFAIKKILNENSSFQEEFMKKYGYVNAIRD